VAFRSAAFGRLRATQISPGQCLAIRSTRSARPPDVDQRGNQVTEPTDDRSPLAKAYQWSARIMVVALEMVLPGLAGYWLDKQLGTVVLFMLLGFGLGCTAAVVHLIRMVRAEQEESKSKRMPRSK
jgi:F0F1-type ATP synthase assembly protein I